MNIWKCELGHYTARAPIVVERDGKRILYCSQECRNAKETPKRPTERKP
jgi:ribosomal protein L24E